ncbi:MAG: ABC-F family ATPase [Gammaproteobacteria bacterium]|nr:ABC-F family ATPase [Gammaproteobacteria bacterium]
MLSAANVTIQFGAKPLFENVCVKFGNGHRYGLIGANGCGKSTLMKILSGDLKPSSGNVSLGPNERLGKLRQDQFAFEEMTVLNTVIMGHEALWQVKAERERLYNLPAMSEAEGMQVAELEVQFAELDGYTCESRAGELLMGLGIPIEQQTGLMSAIAPGWKLRVLLAQALFGDPDILLLDEPTNNLDINAIRWLEEVLAGRECTMVIVSHDRHFLNRICTHMADLDFGELRLYPGNYDDYMMASTEVRERTLANNARKQTQIDDLRQFVSRFSANASKARQATSRARQIEKIKLDDIKPSSRENPYIRFEQGKKLHRLALEVENLSKGFDGSTLFKKLNLMVAVGERVAIIGSNGIGKTTLLNCLAGQLEPERGVVKWSENSELGYVPQNRTHDFATDMTLFDWMNQWRQKHHDEQAIRAVLGQLLFSKEDSQKSVQVISGGEEARMLFGKQILQRPNIMLLDEPTNHLDMESIESLNLALDNYEGTLIFVSHDREFVSSLATRVLEITAADIVDFRGTYDEYLQSRGLERPPTRRSAGD